MHGGDVSPEASSADLTQVHDTATLLKILHQE